MEEPRSPVSTVLSKKSSEGNPSKVSQRPPQSPKSQHSPKSLRSPHSAKLSKKESEGTSNSRPSRWISENQYGNKFKDYYKNEKVGLFARLCMRRRHYENLKHNKWIATSLGDRAERLFVVERHLASNLEEKLEKLRTAKLSRRAYIRKVWLARVTFILRSFGVLLSYFTVDRKTGLHTKILKRTRFDREVCEGPHGTVFEALGSGKMGTVAVKVRDKSIGHVSSLPLLHSYYTVKREILLGNALGHRLTGLAKALGFRVNMFSHDNILRQYGVYDSREFFVEVVEFIDGQSLREYMDKSDSLLAEFDVCQMINSMLSALAYMHERDLMHRDVRTQQILLPFKGEGGGVDFAGARLSDFWLLARIPKDGSLVEQSFPVDIASCAPEVLAEGRWSALADSWSLGCVLFELSYGYPAYHGLPDELMRRIVLEDPQYPDLCKSEVSDKCRQFLEKLLKKKDRLTSEDARNTDWFQQLANDDVDVALPREKRLRGVRLHGKPPRCRGKMKAENLIKELPGGINIGFCTQIGLTFASLEFELTTLDLKTCKWLTYLVISLWGCAENPRQLKVLISEHPWAEFECIAVHTVKSERETQALIHVDRPVQYLKIHCGGNFGGSLGIALRKLTFFGYEVGAIRLRADPSEAKVEGSSTTVNLVSGVRLEGAYEKLYHTSVLRSAKVTNVLNNDIKVVNLVAINSGERYGSTRLVVKTKKMKEPRVDVIAATAHLPYHATIAPGGICPRVKVTLVETIEAEKREPDPDDDDNGLGEQKPPEPELPPEEDRYMLFDLNSFLPTPHEFEKLPEMGFTTAPLVFEDKLDLSWSPNHRLEVQFLNNAGQMHIPIDVGIALFYRLEVAEDDSARDDDEDSRIEYERKQMELRRFREEMGGDTNTLEEEEMEGLELHEIKQVEKEKQLMKELSEAMTTRKFGQQAAVDNEKIEASLCRPEIMEKITPSIRSSVMQQPVLDGKRRKKKNEQETEKDVDAKDDLVSESSSSNSALSARSSASVVERRKGLIPLHARIVGAIGLPAVRTGADHNPNPCCVLETSRPDVNRPQKTKVCRETGTPVWNQDTILYVKENDMLTFHIYLNEVQVPTERVQLLSLSKAFLFGRCSLYVKDIVHSKSEHGFHGKLMIEEVSGAKAGYDEPEPEDRPKFFLKCSIKRAHAHHVQIDKHQDLHNKEDGAKDVLWPPLEDDAADALQLAKKDLANIQNEADKQAEIRAAFRRERRLREEAAREEAEANEAAKYRLQRFCLVPCRSKDPCKAYHEEWIAVGGQAACDSFCPALSRRGVDDAAGSSPRAGGSPRSPRRRSPLDSEEDSGSFGS